MLRTLIRVCAGLLAGAATAWYARVIAHSKQPAPEGRWREIEPDDLSASP